MGMWDGGAGREDSDCWTVMVDGGKLAAAGKAGGGHVTVMGTGRLKDWLKIGSTIVVPNHAAIFKTIWPTRQLKSR